MGVFIFFFVLFAVFFWGISSYLKDRRETKEKAEMEAERERIRKKEEEYRRKEHEKELQENAERSMREREKEQRDAWADKLENYYLQIERKKVRTSLEDMYTKIEGMLEEINKGGRDEYVYREIFESFQTIHIDHMKEEVFYVTRWEEEGRSSKRPFAYLDIQRTVYACKCLLLAETMAGHEPGKEEQVLRPLLDIVQPLREELKKTTHYLSDEAYGMCHLPLDEPDEMERVGTLAQKLEKKIGQAYDYVTFFDKNQSILKGTIPSEFDKDYVNESAMLMWYYAKKKPFEVNRFEHARHLFGRFTEIYTKKEDNENELEYFYGVESVLAQIYAKNQIGGEGTVRQEKSYIDTWLEKKIQWKSYDECCTLASGLAWMELYELELDVLRKLVAGRVPMPAEMQERLSFLESGGIANVKIYEVADSGSFQFDNSTLEWKTEEYNVFFRKLNMKKMWPNYSLAMAKWTKTLPLVSGQKVSFERIYEEFVKLVEDFDGEITCEKTNAKAIDLENVVYENAVLFRFTTERNRCVSVLFSGEKYGRNLNLTILTMFTPDKTLALDSLEKYCLAIKSNTYVESFRESILQTVDEVLKVYESVYDDQEQPAKKKIFEED